MGFQDNNGKRFEFVVSSFKELAFVEPQLIYPVHLYPEYSLGLGIATARNSDELKACYEEAFLASPIGQVHITNVKRHGSGG